MTIAATSANRPEELPITSSSKPGVWGLAPPCTYNGGQRKRCQLAQLTENILLPLSPSLPQGCTYVRIVASACCEDFDKGEDAYFFCILLSSHPKTGRAGAGERASDWASFVFSPDRPTDRDRDVLLSLYLAGAHGLRCRSTLKVSRQTPSGNRCPIHSLMNSKLG